ncbi:MAG: hypothetical protein U0903_13405 [Planctomycetales bacterium]
MDLFLGLKLIDIAVIIGYFVVVTLVGFWASFKVKTDEDYFLGGRTFGKGLLIMHFLCTGTHSEHAVQVAGATARFGLGGIWYQWMWLFSTPFYWLIAPMLRRMRVVTTGDFFRIRYNRSLEMLYTCVSQLFLILSIAMLLRGAGAAIAGATGGAIPTDLSIYILAILFSTYIMVGGLMAAAYTDYLQGVMIVALSILLIPGGLALIGGMSTVQKTLGPEMLSITAPAKALEGNIWFVLSMSVLGLVGIVVQPHIMTASGAGKSEWEARVGMCFGNFIKRFLTIAWAFTGLIAVVRFPEVLKGLDPGSEAGKHASETLFGMAIQHFLGDGWRGLMIACIIAGVTSAEALMVVGAGLFTRNFYQHAVPSASEQHYLWVGRAAAAGSLLAGIIVASVAGSVTQLINIAFQLIGLMGAAFWLGATWRRANSLAVWVSFLAAAGVWLVTAFKPADFAQWPIVMPAVHQLFAMADLLHLRTDSRPMQIALMLSVEFGLLIVVSLITPAQSRRQLDPFFARLYTPVGREQEFSLTTGLENLPESATLGMHGTVLDYERASVLGYRGLQRWGIEIPRMTWSDWSGFLAAWGIVAGLIALLAWLATLGR